MSLKYEPSSELLHICAKQLLGGLQHPGETLPMYACLILDTTGVRELQALLAPRTPQGVLVRGHGGRVISTFSAGGAK